MNEQNKQYFNVKKFLDENFKGWQNGSNIFMFAAPRDIGKSYSTWQLVAQEYAKKDSRFIYMRITKEQLKKPVEEFNEMFANDMKIDSNLSVWKLKEVEKVKRNGDTITSMDYDYRVGWFLSINNYINNKSNEFKDVKFIFIEEIIEDTTNIVGLYDKITNLITTIIRKKENINIIMLANRDTANNEFMVKWGVEPREEELYDDDIIYKIDENIYYIELGDYWFKNLGNTDTLYFKFAQFSKASKNQLSGGYAKDYSKNVKNFFKWIQPTFNCKYAVVFRKVRYYLGTFNYKGEERWAIVNNNDYENFKVNAFCLDDISGLDINNRILDKEDKKEVMEMLYYLIRNQEIIYNSFETMVELESALKLMLN